MKPVTSSAEYPPWLSSILFMFGILCGSLVSATEMSLIDGISSELTTSQIQPILGESRFSWRHEALIEEFSPVTSEFASGEETADEQNYAEDYEKFKQSLESTGIADIELALDQAVNVYDVGAEELVVPIAKTEIYRAGQNSNIRRVSSSAINLPVNINCDRAETSLWLCVELGW